MSSTAITVRLLGTLLAAAATFPLNAQIVIPGLDPQEPLEVRQNMELGTAVGISGGTALVGAPGTDGHGAVYVFSHTGSTWTRSAKLLAPDIAPGRFGTQIAYDGTALIADAERQHVYYFVFDGGKWRPRAILSGGVSGFGAAMAMEGCVALITFSRRYGTQSTGVRARVQSLWHERWKLALHQVIHSRRLAGRRWVRHEHRALGHATDGGRTGLGWRQGRRLLLHVRAGTTGF